MNITEFARTVEPNTKVILETRTSVKMNKKDVESKQELNPYTEIFKLSKVLVSLNVNYQDRMNEALTREGKEANFTSGEMSYGTMVGNALLENKDQLYLKCIEEERLGKSSYELADGMPIEYEDFKRFVPVSKPKEDAEPELVKPRNFKISSIIGYELV